MNDRRHRHNRTDATAHEKAAGSEDFPDSWRPAARQHHMGPFGSLRFKLISSAVALRDSRNQFRWNRWNCASKRLQADLAKASVALFETTRKF